MPRGLKRKHNSHSELFDAMAAQASNRDAVLQTVPRPIPTPETQELYNRFRQEQERQEEERRSHLTPESLQQIQTGNTGFLQLPSPSQATVSSPSPSCPSTTHSISHDLDDMGLDDQTRPKKIRRPGRNGPLTEVRKRKTALMRKLGACDECRQRRVACEHFDLYFFEVAYQALRASEQEASPSFTHGFQPAIAESYQPRLGHRADLLGVGVGVGVTHNSPIGHPFPSIQESFHPGRDAFVDNDPLRDQQPVASARLEAIMSAIQQPQPTVFNMNPTVFSPNSQYLSVTTLSTPQNIQEVPIGCHVAPLRQQWVCRWGSDGYGSSLFYAGSMPCNLEFDDVESLKRHFTAHHAAIYKERYSWICVKCKLELSNPDRSSPCLRCRHPGQLAWRAWCWGKVDIPYKTTSLPLGRAGSHDGSPSNGSSYHSTHFPSPTGGGGYSNSWTSPFGGYSFGNHGSGSGTGHSQMAVHTASSPDAEQPAAGACCEKLPSAPCHVGGSLITSVWHPVSYPEWHTMSGTAAKTALLRHACPAAIVLVFFAIAMIDSWISNGRGRLGGGGVNHVVSWILSSVAPRGRVTVLDMSLACVAAGLVATWVCRHVRSQSRRRGRGGEVRGNESTGARVVVGSSLSGRDGPLFVAISAA